jgi:hypothetical protein
MKIVYYQEKNITKVFFACNTIPSYQYGRLQLRVVGKKDWLTIYGDDFIIKKVYENLLAGVEKHVLVAMLNKLTDKEILQKLYAGNYIE